LDSKLSNRTAVASYRTPKQPQRKCLRVSEIVAFGRRFWYDGIGLNINHSGNQGRRRVASAIRQVLVVDDNDATRDIIRCTLSAEEYVVATAGSGSEALRQLDGSSFQVVLTDIQMPKMSGYDLLAAIRRTRPQTVVIIITGFGTIEDAVRAIKQGAFDYLTKPFNIEQVKLVVDRAFRHYDLQTENERLQSKLRRSEELAFVGRLAARVAHELNNPLDGALRFTNLSLGKLGDQDPITEYQREVKNALLRMAGIVKALLEYSRSINTTNVPESLHKLIRQAVELVHGREGIAVQCEFGDNTDVFCSGEIIQVFINLIKNAFDAMGSSGALAIATAVEGEMVVIQFEDTGCGIHEELHEKVFYPFFTTKDTSSGTGLGLAISSEIVEKHNGTIHLKSEAGKGSEFTVRLPLVRDLAQ